MIEFALSVLFLVIGLALATLAVAVSAQSFYRVWRWQRCTGVLVGYKREEESFLPRVEYSVDSETYTFVASSGRGIRGWQKGDVVPILYDPEKPARADVATFLSLWSFPLCSGLLSLPFLLGSGMRLWRALILGLVFLAPDTVSAQPDAASSADVLKNVNAWLQIPRDSRPAIPDEIAKTALTKEDAAALTKALWNDRVSAMKVERADEMKAKVLTHGDKKMKYEVVRFGESASGQPLFISMHGGGGAPAKVNESQWLNQIKLANAYQPKAGLYVAPRAPTDSWNLWHEAHIDPLFARLIENMVAVEGVDPNRVYLMGYSAGGDGVYQLAPRMSDRFAAASMMAGHPNEASPVGLRNLPFTIHVGANDSAYGRNNIAAAWATKLAELQNTDSKGYVHWVHIHEGRGHWMNLEDKEAIPWMEKHTRNPLPDRIVWCQDDVTHDRSYWLGVSKEDAKGGQIITAERSGQNITITTKDNSCVIVLLNDAMLDMDQPVNLTWNGVGMEPCRVNRSLAVIRRTLEERGDPGLVFSGELVLSR